VPELPTPDDDPITSKSYALYYAVATAVLTASLFWALWDEAYGQRPWKRYQEVFKQRYSAFLKTTRAKSRKSQQEVESSPDYQKLEEQYKKASEQAKPQITQLNQRIGDLSAQILAVQNVFTDKRAYVSAETYEIETDTDSASKRSKQQKLDRWEQQLFTVVFPDGSRKKYNYEQLEAEYNGLKDQRTAANSQLGDVLKPVTAISTEMQQYVSDHMVSLTPTQVTGLENKVEDLSPAIHQVVIPDPRNSGNPIMVDRCESCHLGIREPLKITAADLAAPGQKPDDYARAFVSHSNEELLTIHDPEKFGCSTCHQGNGRATTSIVKAHGNYEHWLWPLFPKENVEAGCQNCHSRDMVLIAGSAGQTISEGKFLFEQRGCMGCHKYQGYNAEPDELRATDQQIKQLEQQKIDNLKMAADYTHQGDQASDNTSANLLYTKAETLKVDNSKLDGQIHQLDLQTRDLMRDMKKVGPNLKEIRAKLNRNWIPVWLHKPTDFRPTTKMPNFRFNDEEIRSIAAYLWQTALKDPIPHAAPGDAAHGKELFETRGCLACHSIGEGDQMQGGDFAANLTRVGEKVNYDYLVRWVHNPRERIRPYCPYEKKDIGPEDYAKHGLPYLFDFDHTTCPNDGHELQVENMTVMPSLRLSQQDAQDIASYLITLKEKDPSSYPDASYMDDPKLKAEGEKWIRQFGCAGCHEISGFEDERGIGTELTTEGSKPIERLDFALFTDMAQRGEGEPITDPVDRARLPEGPAKKPWYTLKGFFEHKLSEPNIFDKGMIKSDTDKLRMPNPHLTPEQIRALTTFLVGSEDTSAIPASFQYEPEDERRDIQEGWWIVRKYNCMGCHQFYPGQQTVLMGMKRYQDPDWKEQLPPKLLTEGARVSPQWLEKFLANPALSTTDTNRNGVRPYLKAHMPTFFFSNHEIRVLVRFFQALSKQPMPYLPEQVPVLTAKETDMARSLFTSQAAPCLKCHATGDPNHDKFATAPNFLLAKDRLKPNWVARWLLDPQAISPGTSMPSGLFRQQSGHWVFSGPTPPSFKGYEQDQNALLMRYIFQLTPEEQHKLSGMMPRGAAPAKKASNRAPHGGKRVSGALRATPNSAQASLSGGSR
jgi:cytochrome c2